MTTYADARSRIQTGDILVFEGRSLFGLLIRWATASPAAHVALARWDSGRLMVYQSMEGHGVECIPASKQVSAEDTVWVLRPYRYQPEPIYDPRTGYLDKYPQEMQPPAIPYSTSIMLQTAMVALGDKYSWWSILRIAFRILCGWLNLKAQTPFELRQGEFICSEYVAVCLKAAGYAVPWDGLGFVAPSDFLKDPGLAHVVTITP